MKILVEHKGTATSKFTFTLEEVRVKIANEHLNIENELVEKADYIYNLLIDAGWTGITLRSNALFEESLNLKDSYKNIIAVVLKDTVIWKSEKGTR